MDTIPLEYRLRAIDRQGREVALDQVVDAVWRGELSADDFTIDVSADGPPILVAGGAAAINRTEVYPDRRQRMREVVE